MTWPMSAIVDAIRRRRQSVRTDPGWAVLASGTPLGDLARIYDLPCCSLVALWAREVAGLTPRPATTPGMSFAAVYAKDALWWEQANIWDPELPYSSLGAVQQLLGGEIAIMLGANAPPLTAGRWHVVQRWRAGEGHTYLVRADEHGVGCTVVQSSEGPGYRVSRGEWVGGAGLQDYHVGVLTLPDWTAHRDVVARIGGGR